MEGNSGVAVVDIRAVMGNFTKNCVTLDDMEPQSFGRGENSEDNVVRMDNGLQCPNTIVRVFDEIAGFGRKLTQFFKLSHLFTPTQLTE